MLLLNQLTKFIERKGIMSASLQWIVSKSIGFFSVFFFSFKYDSYQSWFNWRQNKYDGQILRALGYGASDYGTDNTYYLKYVDVPAISNSQCSAYYGNSLAITAQDLCHSSSATADTCQVNNCHFDATPMSKIICFFFSFQY